MRMIGTTENAAASGRFPAVPCCWYTIMPMKYPGAPTTLAQLEKSKPSAIDLPDVARLNHVTPDETLPKGRIVKRVEGFNPERVGGST